MKNKKTRSKVEKSIVYDTMKAASAGIPLPMRTLKWAKGEGCPAFRGARIHVSELLRWLEANPFDGSSGDPREEKLREEIRKLRIANDAKEGRLVERAWVGSRIQHAAGELNAARSKSEAEHPTKFAAAAGDVAHCRTIVRGIWNDIFESLQGLSKHFEEGA